jgi:hypothetical protein
MVPCPGQELLGAVTSHGPFRECNTTAQKSSGGPAVLQREMPGGSAEVVAVESAAEVPNHSWRQAETQRAKPADILIHPPDSAYSYPVDATGVTSAGPALGAFARAPSPPVRLGRIRARRPGRFANNHVRISPPGSALAAFLLCSRNCEVCQKPEQGGCRFC